jgi:hypothetical protein
MPVSEEEIPQRSIRNGLQIRRDVQRTSMHALFEQDVVVSKGLGGR